MSDVVTLPGDGLDKLSGGRGIFTRNDYGLYQFVTPGTGSFTIPANVNYIREMFIVGGGGGGARAGASNGSSGGGGAYVWLKAIPVVPGSTLTYNVGAAGVGGSTSSGTNGGSSSVTVNGVTYTCTGGTGALGGSLTVAPAGGTYTRTGTLGTGASETPASGTVSGGRGVPSGFTSGTPGAGVNLFTYGVQRGGNAGGTGYASNNLGVRQTNVGGLGGPIGFSGGGGSYITNGADGAHGAGGAGASAGGYITAVGGTGGAGGANTGGGGGGGGTASGTGGVTYGNGGNGGSGYVAFIF